MFFSCGLMFEILYCPEKFITVYLRSLAVKLLRNLFLIYKVNLFIFYSNVIGEVNMKYDLLYRKGNGR